MTVTELIDKLVVIKSLYPELEVWAGDGEEYGDLQVQLVVHEPPCKFIYLECY